MVHTADPFVEPSCTQRQPALPADRQADRMPRRAWCTGLVTCALALLAAPVALAAPTATFNGSTLTVTGDATADTFAVSRSGGYIAVTGPAGVNDPDAAGPLCTATGGTVSCADNAVAAVVVQAGGGDDTLTTGPIGFTSLLLDGGAGNDTLTTSGDSFGAVRLDGGAGDDVLNAGAGSLRNDTGGVGNDTFNGSAQSADVFEAEPGSDVYHGGTRVPPPEEASEDPVAYQRNHAPDAISYAKRADAQTVSLDDAANDGSAGEGDNVGADVEDVSSGSGGDRLTAGAAGASLHGGDGDDTLAGGPSDDNLDGQGGSDSLAGNAGDDTLDDGDDTPPYIFAVEPALPVAGNDRLDGGAGRDVLRTDRGADDLVGGSGKDTAPFSRPVRQSAGVTTPLRAVPFEISLDDQANDGARGATEGDNVHSDIEEIQTGFYFFFFGGGYVGGDDIVTGSAHAESISTFDGNDTITPGGGSDDVSAGRGDDTVSAVDQSTDRIDCELGNDAAAVDLPGGQPERADVTYDCEAITGQPFAAPNPPPLPPVAPVAPVAPVPPVDTSKAVMTLTGKTIRSAAFIKSGTLTLTVRCNKACSVEGEAFASGATLHSTVGKLSVGSGNLPLGTGSRKLRVKIAKRYLTTYKRRLRTRAQRKKGISFSVRATASDALGIVVQSSRTVKVRG